MTLVNVHLLIIDDMAYAKIFLLIDRDVKFYIKDIH